MLTIWGRTDSSNVQALMWCVAELGLPHRRIDAGHRFGGTDTPEFLAMNPNGTVPVLQDGDAPPLWETGAILRYLAGRYGPESFWPADPVARADVDRWAEWAKINIALGFTGPVFWPVWRFPESRDPVALERALSALDAKLRIAEDRLSRHPFLVGDTLTLADIAIAPAVFRWRLWEGSAQDILPDLPNLLAYHENLRTHAGYRRHVEGALT